MQPRPSKEEQKATLLAYAKLIAPRPVLIGRAATHLGWWATLPETEALLEEMVRDDVLRQLVEKERRAYGIRFGYVLV